MRFVYSDGFLKQYRRLQPNVRRIVERKLRLFLQNRFHPSLRYKTVQALKKEDPPVKEISISMGIRVTLQEFEDHIYLRNIGTHNILP